MKKTLQITIVVLCIAGCSVLIAMRVFPSHSATHALAVLPGPDHSADRANDSMVACAIAQLRTGQVVLRMGLGADSRLLSQLNKHDKSYSHCGIVLIEHGYPFVYHSIGGEDNPDERLRRDSARRFFSPRGNIAIAAIQYPFSAAGLTRLGSVVQDYYHHRPRFDMKFDLRTDDKLYCTEFVYKAINKATNDTAYIGTSTVMAGTYVGTDNLFVNPHASFVFQMRFK